MTPHELEQTFSPKVRKLGGVRLLPANEAMKLLSAASSFDLQLVGVEAFKIHVDGNIEPSMEYSNICYGTVEEGADGVEFQPDLRLRSPYNTSKNAVSETIQLIEVGSNNGFTWFEVTLFDKQANRLLFSSSAA